MQFVGTDYEHDRKGYLFGVTTEDLGNGRRSITLSLNHANDAIQDSLMAYNRDLTDFDPPADVDIAAIKKSYSTK